MTSWTPIDWIIFGSWGVIALFLAILAAIAFFGVPGARR